MSYNVFEEIKPSGIWSIKAKKHTNASLKSRFVYSDEFAAQTDRCYACIKHLLFNVVAVVKEKCYRNVAGIAAHKFLNFVSQLS